MPSVTGLSKLLLALGTHGSWNVYGTDEDEQHRLIRRLNEILHSNYGDIIGSSGVKAKHILHGAVLSHNDFEHPGTVAVSGVHLMINPELDTIGKVPKHLVEHGLIELLSHNKSKGNFVVSLSRVPNAFGGDGVNDKMIREMIRRLSGGENRGHNYVGDFFIFRKGNDALVMSHKNTRYVAGYLDPLGIDDDRVRSMAIKKSKGILKEAIDSIANGAGIGPVKTKMFTVERSPYVIQTEAKQSEQQERNLV